jgi:hypothetical protein
MSTNTKQLSESDWKLAEEIVACLLRGELEIDHDRRLAILAAATEMAECLKKPYSPPFEKPA